MPAAGSTHIEALFVGRRPIGPLRACAHAPMPWVSTGRFTNDSGACDADQYRSLAHSHRLVHAAARRLHHDAAPETHGSRL